MRLAAICICALLFTGCGLSAHAVKATRLEKRVTSLETKFGKFVELDAISVAERQAAQEYLADAIKWLKAHLAKQKKKGTQ